MNKLINTLKKNNEDWEWYPTSSEIVKDLHECLLEYKHNTNKSLLDIGAGNGLLFKQLRELDKQIDEYTYSFGDAYAIEKSKILIEEMESNVFVLGTDFHQQTLIDKKVKNIFCNPPYSEYEQWVTRIIEESNCSFIYLVIPERWINSDSINNAIKARDAKYKIIGSYSFEDSEYRKARAKVNLVKIEMRYSYNCDNPRVDPFDIFFDKHFKFKESSHGLTADLSNTSVIKKLVKGKNLIETLVELYNEELNNIHQTFNKITSIELSLLKELGADKHYIIESLKHKYKNLKNIYWKELFDNLEKITNRLTKKTREKLVDKLTGNTSVDFTLDNAYSVVIWAIKSANKYMDEQTIELFKTLSSKDSTTNYKSNERFYSDNWRFNQEATHYKLEYRIIAEYCDMFTESWRNRSNGKEFLNDLFIVARNLGYDIDVDAYDLDVERGKNIDITYIDDNNEDQLFCKCRFYQNGNGHFKFNQKFMLKLNLIVGKLLGWINNKQQAVDELEVDYKSIDEIFENNYQLGFSNIKLIGN